MVITCPDIASLIPECGGGFADVYRCEYGGRPVAAKVIRVYLDRDPDRVQSVGISFRALHKPTTTTGADRRSQEFCREAVTWRHLRHPNVIPLLGAALDTQMPRFALVSEWMDNGNINNFLKNHGDVNRVQLVSYHVCVCDGWYN